jgi:hypothetical protein
VHAIPGVSGRNRSRFYVFPGQEAVRQDAQANAEGPDPDTHGSNLRDPALVVPGTKPSDGTFRMIWESVDERPMAHSFETPDSPIAIA